MRGLGFDPWTSQRWVERREGRMVKEVGQMGVFYNITEVIALLICQ